MNYYRYRTINQFSIDIITKNELYFASPREFNDPFEFEFLMKHDAHIDKIKKFLEESKLYDFKTEFKKAGDEKVRKFLEGDMGSTVAAQLREEFRNEFLDQSGILCLADSPTNISMWAHYGDNHRGICFEFNFMHENFGEHFKVNYTSEVPSFNYFESYESRYKDMTKKIISSKSLNWEHEREYRFILSRPGVVRFHPNSLRAAYLGMNVDQNNLIFQSMAIHYPELPLYFLKSAEAEYAFEIAHHEPILAKNFILEQKN